MNRPTWFDQPTHIDAQWKIDEVTSRAGSYDCIPTMLPRCFLKVIRLNHKPLSTSTLPLICQIENDVPILVIPAPPSFIPVPVCAGYRAGIGIFEHIVSE